MKTKVFCKTFDFDKDLAILFAHFSSLPFSFFLDSSLQQGGRGRFSFIGFEPFETCCASGADALSQLSHQFKVYQTSFLGMPAPFGAGGVGYLSYDLGLLHEQIPSKSSRDFILPDVCFGFYDSVIIVDHLLKKMHVVATGLPEKKSALAQEKAKEKIKKICYYLQEIEDKGGLAFEKDFEQEGGMPLKLKSNFTKSQYIKLVKKALSYIRKGDIYEINLSQRFLLEEDLGSDIAAFELYQVLRALSPSNFGCFFNAGDFQIISHSPEQFLHIENGVVQTFPMKGTRPRGRDLIEDEIYKNELLNSVKEKAELLMVTDLERNDLGRVCDYGSVHVRSMRLLERYSTVFQTISIVEGKLRNDKDGFDVLRACFPSGSVTGCPKIRSMQIINELENLRRGPYTGSLGYMGFDGNMDFNILIRTILKKDNKISFHVGGGIVADSIPEREYEETLIKAEALLKSLQRVLRPCAKV